MLLLNLMQSHGKSYSPLHASCFYDWLQDNTVVEGLTPAISVCISLVRHVDGILQSPPGFIHHASLRPNLAGPTFSAAIQSHYGRTAKKNPPLDKAHPQHPLHQKRTISKPPAAKSKLCQPFIHFQQKSTIAWSFLPIRYFGLVSGGYSSLNAPETSSVCGIETQARHALQQAARYPSKCRFFTQDVINLV